MTEQEINLAVDTLRDEKHALENRIARIDFEIWCLLRQENSISSRYRRLVQKVNEARER